MTTPDHRERRTLWADYIYETSNVARYIWPSGTVITPPSPSDDKDVREFLSKLRDHEQSATLLGIGYYVSLPQVRRFVLVDLPLLIRQLGHSSAATSPAVGSTIRGKVLWPDTILGRLSGKVPRGRYLVRSSERQLDIPENRLLKRYLVDLAEGLTTLSSTSGSKGCLKIAEISEAIQNAIASPYLQSVTLVGSPTAQMSARARRNRNASYGRAATLAEHFRTLRGEGKWLAIADLLAAGWMAPVTDDDLFELFCLVSILDALENDLGFGSPTEYGLIWRARRHVASFQHSGVDVSVFFNQSPVRTFGISTRYGRFIGDHSFYKVASRRPDIMLVMKTGSSEKRFIVEAKDTLDAKYARDSVYKVFGYLYDFSQMWTDIMQTGLKALMIVPDHVSFTGGPDPDREIMAISLSDRAGLVAALAMMKASVSNPQS